MKHKRLTIVLLSVILLVSALLPMTMCQTDNSTPENPFNMGASTSAGNGQSNADPDTGFDANKAHGEKILYSKKALTNLEFCK